MKKLIHLTVLIASCLIFTIPLFAGQTEDANTVELTGFVPPEPVELVKPERFFYLRSHEVEGYITLEMTVSEEGYVENAYILYKTSQLAVNNAIDAVAKWKFTPATLNGVPVKSKVVYHLPFGPDLEIYHEKEFAMVE